jgi:tetratricopeptide (TPR) repeat protein
MSESRDPRPEKVLPGQPGTNTTVTGHFEPEKTSSVPSDSTTVTGAYAGMDATAGHSSTTPARPPGTFVGVESIPGYEFIRELGRGGMGVVFEARELKLNRSVALKMLLGSGSSGDSLVRFLTEAEAVAAINHPHIVRVYAYGEHDGRPYMALEYCSSGSLADRLAGGSLPPKVAAELVEKIARGVQAAHAQGIVHRDLKPGNVLFDEGGEPKVADFGLAKRAASDLTQTGAVMGTPAYMAPEQAGGQTREAGPASDVWALGVILYECLTGTRPFIAERTDQLLARILMSDPDPLRSSSGKLPRDLETICLKCLEKEPARRYSSALALAQDLERFRAGEAILARPDGFVRKVWRKTRKRALTIGLVLALLAATAAAAWLVVRSGSTRHGVDLAQRIDAGIDAAVWPPEHRDQLEGWIEELRALDPAQAETARRKLIDRAVRRFREAIGRPRVASSEVPGLESDLKWLVVRDPETAHVLDKELHSRLRTWQTLFEAAPPFANVADVFSAGTVRVDARGLLPAPGVQPMQAGKMRTRSTGAARIEVEFSPEWDQGRQVGVAIDETASGGYQFLLVPAQSPSAEERSQGPKAPPTFRESNYRVDLRVVRNRMVLRQHTLYLSAGPLRLAAERDGERLWAQVNDTEPVTFFEVVPIVSPEGTYGLIWPEGAAVSRIRTASVLLPASASLLERADDLYSRGNYAEAMPLYEAQANASRGTPNETEARCKVGLCLMAANRPDDAVQVFEAVAAAPGERWPAIATCQAWLIRLRQNRLEDAEAILNTAAVRFNRKQFAKYIPESVRQEINSSIPVSPAAYAMPTRALLERLEAKIKLVDLIGEDDSGPGERLHLAMAAAMLRDDTRATAVARDLVEIELRTRLSAAEPSSSWNVLYSFYIYFWLLRQQGLLDRAEQELDAIRHGYPMKYLPGVDPADLAYQRVLQWLHMERAWVAFAKGDWVAAENEIEAYLPQAQTLGEHYDYYHQVRLARGFCLERRGDVDGAVKSWREATFSAFNQKYPNSRSPQTNRVPPRGRKALIGHWIAASLANDLTDADARDIWKIAVSEIANDPLMAQAAGSVQISPNVIRAAWQSPRGRELARKMATFDLHPVDHLRTPIRLLVYEMLRQGLFDGKPTAEQDEVAWNTVVRMCDQVFDGKLAKPQAFQFVLAWKGTAGSFGWGGLASAIQPELRGPLAYIVAMRYQKLGKPGDAITLQRTAVADAPSGSPLQRLAREELDRLTGKKSGTQSLPLAPPPRAVGGR